MTPEIKAYHIQSPGWSSGMIRPSGVPTLVTRVLMGEAPGSNPGSGPLFFLSSIFLSLLGELHYLSFFYMIKYL